MRSPDTRCFTDHARALTLTARREPLTLTPPLASACKARMKFHGNFPRIYSDLKRGLKTPVNPNHMPEPVNLNDAARHVNLNTPVTRATLAPGGGGLIAGEEVGGIRRFANTPNRRFRQPLTCTRCYAPGQGRGYSDTLIALYVSLSL